MDVFDSIRTILFKILRHLLKKQSYLKNFKSQKFFQFLKDNKENVEKYRPISILLVFSKALERIMYELWIFMNNNLFHEDQFVFQINNSTEHSILHFTRDVAQNFDNGKFLLGVFIDLSKAFDTVHHHILLLKFKTSCG